MSKHNQAIISLVIVVILVVCFIAYFVMRSTTPAVETLPITTVTDGQQQAESIINPDAKLVTPGNDTSNAALQSDINTIDSQINGLNADAASVNTSVNNN